MQRGGGGVAEGRAEGFLPHSPPMQGFLLHRHRITLWEGVASKKGVGVVSREGGRRQGARGEGARVVSMEEEEEEEKQQQQQQQEQEEVVAVVVAVEKEEEEEE